MAMKAREIMTPDPVCVRRLPVIDGHDLIGIVALADVARALSDPPVGTLVEALSVDRLARRSSDGS